MFSVRFCVKFKTHQSHPDKYHPQTPPKLHHQLHYSPHYSSQLLLQFFMFSLHCSSLSTSLWLNCCCSFNISFLIIYFESVCSQVLHEFMFVLFFKIHKKRNWRLFLWRNWGGFVGWVDNIWRNFKKEFRASYFGETVMCSLNMTHGKFFNEILNFEENFQICLYSGD